VPPAYADEFDAATNSTWRFYRTAVERADQVVNGRAWIQTFEHVLQKLPRPRRVLGVSLSESADPRHSMPAFVPKQRNDALRAMRDPVATPDLPEGARHGIGTHLRLPSGDEVLLLCNVGPQAPPQLPFKFRDMPLADLAFIAIAARCPHMGACMREGELKDIEDIVANASVPSRRAIVRCPQHNMQFDAYTGEGVGNYLMMKRYPVQVAHGAVYIGVQLSSPENQTLATVHGGANAVAEMTTCGEQQQEGDPDGMEVDMEGVAKQAAAQPQLDNTTAVVAGVEVEIETRCRSRTPRVLRYVNTMG